MLTLYELLSREYVWTVCDFFFFFFFFVARQWKQSLELSSTYCLFAMYCFSGRETFVEYWQLLIWWFEGGALSIKWNRILFSIFERAVRCLFLSDFSWGRCSFEYTVCIVFNGFITFVVNLYSIWGHYYTCGQFLFHLRALLHLWSIITFVASTSFLNSCHLPDRCSTPYLRHIGSRIWTSKCILVYGTPRQLPAAQFLFFTMALIDHIHFFFSSI